MKKVKFFTKIEERIFYKDKDAKSSFVSCQSNKHQKVGNETMAEYLRFSIVFCHIIIQGSRYTFDFIDYICQLLEEINKFFLSLSRLLETIVIKICPLVYVILILLDIIGSDHIFIGLIMILYLRFHRLLEKIKF
jgi:hypothetical protein